MKKGYQNALKAGALHCLWSGVILGGLAMDAYSGATISTPWREISVSWTIIRGLGVATFFSVIVGMLAAEDTDDFGLKMMGAMILLPLLVILVVFHVTWLIYSLVVWQWHYDLHFFLRSFVWPVACLVWGLWSLVWVPLHFVAEIVEEILP